MKKTLNRRLILPICVLLILIVCLVPAFNASVSATSEPEIGVMPYEDSQGEIANYTESVGMFGQYGANEEEGPNPVYILVFADEEERSLWGTSLWKDYSEEMIENGDRELVETFGIDIRILDFLEWDSDDGGDMIDLLYELKRETTSYLNTLYHGAHWTGWVDVIVGITNQMDWKHAGCAFHLGRFTVINWQSMWQNDNIFQHEFSHIFGASDHEDTCCIMATGHEHFQGLIVENGVAYLIMENIICAYTCSHWCQDCYEAILSHKDRFNGPIWQGNTGWGGEAIPIDPIRLAFPYIALVSAFVMSFAIVRQKKRRLKRD